MTTEDLKRKYLDVAAAKTEAMNAYHAALCAEYPFRPGDIIRNASGYLAKVTKVFVQYDVARISAVLAEKDGTFALREAGLWHKEWENPVLVERAA